MGIESAANTAVPPTAVPLTFELPIPVPSTSKPQSKVFSLSENVGAGGILLG